MFTSAYGCLGYLVEMKVVLLFARPCFEEGVCNFCAINGTDMLAIILLCNDSWQK
jgi:hypothetical protein